MDRRRAINAGVDVDKLTLTECRKLLKGVLAPKATIEVDCIEDNLLYASVEEEDHFLELTKKGKAVFKKNFPKRYVEDAKGKIIDENGKKYREATVEDIDKELKKVTDIKMKVEPEIKEK